MPRRHKNPPHIRFTFHDGEKDKTRYPSKQAAEKAAEHRMLEVLGLELAVYQSANGGWYLTSKKDD